MDDMIGVGSTRSRRVRLVAAVFLRDEHRSRAEPHREGLSECLAANSRSGRIVLTRRRRILPDKQKSLAGGPHARRRRSGIEARCTSPSQIASRGMRHRPDRILVGEVRGAEAFDLLQALNTGHLGSLSTIHANSAEQAFTRLAHCVLTANVGLPHRSTREAIALAIHLVVHIARVGSHRRVTEVVA